ncbi:DUF4190 domain-containing protein [Arthrobacter dokdonensis]|uniref:DUF4190 domain-containing protein n=1 Tax=Arthrobacter dokdonellae TaxID=2211210 RepID=UPI00149457B6|nr:DUF4190 domain-containing protein [Arthrobacter dokdonellae]
MSDRPSNAPGEEYFYPGVYVPMGQEGTRVTARPPLSRTAIAGLVVACVSLVVLGFLGVLGMILGVMGLREIRSGRARGRGLAVAGMAVGAVAFIFYLVNLFVRTQ